MARGEQVMLPAVVARQVQSSLLDYLRTTFRLQDQALERALFETLRDPERGLFRGPYLDVRLPFRKAPEPWEDDCAIDYRPGFTPYTHQLRAFERLSARDRAPQNTLVTTGTGSGKTECFLYPLLDHCRRARERGEQGVKAIILYPMNALASDQTVRFARELNRPELRSVSAGLYIGGKGKQGAAGPDHLIDDRKILRQAPPDILLTNYRMLDFLLLRPEDARLWGLNGPRTLQYLVLDELHTYDGAQGSDVACLIRRLKDRLAIPKGHLCCVGTSATIGGEGEAPRRLLAEFASQVFGEPFDTDSLIGEDRLSFDEAFPRDDSRDAADTQGDDEHVDKDPFATTVAPGEPDPLDPDAYGTPEDYLKAQVQLWIRHPVIGPVSVGHELAQHGFLRRLLTALGGRDRRPGPRAWTEVADYLASMDPDFRALPRERQWLALCSFVSLLAHARSFDSSGGARPFVSVQVQLWVRELSGLVQAVAAEGHQFEWRDELKPVPGTRFLPMVYCRECGDSGVAAVQRAAETHLLDDPGMIGEAWLRGLPGARYLRFGRFPERTETPSGEQLEFQQYLCPVCLRVEGGAECSNCREPAVACLPVRLHVTLTEKKRFLSTCPSCNAEDGLTMLGSRAATLSSVAISELYLSRFNSDKKLLAFTDSVQDASHRAGFFAARAYRFTLRTAIQSVLEARGAPIPLAEFAPRLLDHWTEQLGEAKAAATLLPPDLKEDPAYTSYRAANRPSKPQRDALRRLLETRLGWEVTREYGLAVAQGRSLDQTGCSTLTPNETALTHAAKHLHEYLVNEQPIYSRQRPELATTLHYLEGLLQRLRLRGGIHHALLARYERTGFRGSLSKRREPWLSPFGRHSSRPRFWYHGEKHEEFEPLFSKPSASTWYRDFTARIFGGEPQDVGINALLSRAVQLLARYDLIETAPDSKGVEVSRLLPEALIAVRAVQGVRCPRCGHRLTLAESAAARFVGATCLGFRCEGHYTQAPSDAGASYYQRLYKSGRIERIFTGEHTGLLERETRENLEREFRQAPKPDSPNLLTCTPTLEMGIDIGDLSSVLLCAVPPAPANYVQRVGRAGRRTGNAVVLTFVNRRPHDLYFHAEPLEMLRGEITPPGCFLDAPEVLARQMLAHAMDQWARAMPERPIPRKMSLIAGQPDPEKFPYSFYEFYGKQRDALTERFLALFADQLSDDNAARLRVNAAADQLVQRVRDAFEAVSRERKDLKRRVKDLEDRRRELEAHSQPPPPGSDPDQEGRSLEDELRDIDDAKGAYQRILVELNNKYPLNVLTDAGALPNYAFPEPGVTLNALLYGGGARGSGEQPGADASADDHRGQRFEYLRAASSAIREFAPFNTFYAEGHRVRVSQIDVGNRAKPLLETWRLCPECPHMERVLADTQPPDACPACGAGRFRDEGQKKQLVHFRRAWSSMKLHEASTADDAEDREEAHYQMGEFIDVRDEHRRGARLIEEPDVVFGYELLQNLELREINFGLLHDTDLGSDVAGQHVAQRGFCVCRQCGKVSEAEARAEHAPYCKVRTANAKEELTRVCLYRQVRSEAIRVLLPVANHEVDRMTHSIRAALYLGFRKKFRGKPAHLRITTATEPRGGVKRRFLIIYDTVPGGTGFLAELWKNNGFLEVLELALSAMQNCVCAAAEHKDGCYRCLYAYQESRYLPHISRSEAIALFENIVAKKARLQDVHTLSNAAVDEVLESELERLFVDRLAGEAEGNRWAWERSMTGGKSAWRLQTSNSAWLFVAQVDVGPADGVAERCRPDFVAYCTSDKTVRPLAIFCDGFAFHALPNKEGGRIGDDIKKRRALLESERFHVWALTWKDLEQSAHGGAPEAPVTLFTDVRVKMMKQMEGQKGWATPLERRHQSSFELLLQYLDQPADSSWKELPQLLGTGALIIAPPNNYAPAALDRLASDLCRRPARFEPQLTPHGAGLAQRYGGLERRPWSALLAEATMTALQQQKTEQLRFVLRVFDEPAARRDGEFEASWRAFLHAWNLLQFHPGTVEVTSSEHLQEVGLAAGDSSAPPPPNTRAPATTSASPKAASEHPESPYARLMTDFPEAEALAARLETEGLPVPIEFEGFGDIAIELDALLAWPEQRIALCWEPSERDRTRWRDRGWAAFDLAGQDIEPIVTELKQRL